jgi:hypothetical protein
MGKGKRKQIGGLESSETVTTDGTLATVTTDGTSAKDTSLFSWVPSLSWFSSFFTSTQPSPVTGAKNTETSGGKKHKKSVKKSKGKKHQKSAKR